MEEQIGLVCARKLIDKPVKYRNRSNQTRIGEMEDPPFLPPVDSLSSRLSGSQILADNGRSHMH